MSTAPSRRLVLAAGLGVLVLLGIVLFLRRVDTIEVVAVLLFIPVFLAFLYGHLLGGIVGGLMATIVYAMLRAPALDAVGSGRVTSVIVGRGVAYLAFGVLGGWAAQQLDRSLDKLDLYDQIDDLTGLFNARFFVQETQLEMDRAGRYQTFFSVCMVEVPAGPVDELSRRKRRSLLRDLGGQLGEAVRAVDKAVQARDGSVHRVAVILPETGADGAAVFTQRLAARLVDFVRSRGAWLGDAEPVTATFTFPGDEEQLAQLRSQFAAIDRTEHPAHPVENAPSASS